MRTMRSLLTVVILLNLALVVVLLEARGTLLRYEFARRSDEVRKTRLENRRLLLAVTAARQPEALAHRAREFGLPLKEEERGRSEQIARDRRRP